MSSKLNPAQRLHALLLQASRLPGNKKTAQIWEEVLHAQKDSRTDLLRKLGLLINLYIKVREEVTRAAPDATELYLKKFGNIEASLYFHNLDAPWESFKSHINEATLYSLEMCGHLLGISGISDIPSNELDSLKKILLEAMDELAASDIEQEFKAFVLAHLKIVLNAILDYEISGLAGVQEALEQAFGAVVLRPKITNKVQTEAAGSKFWKTLERVAFVVTIAAGTDQVATSMYQKLLPPPHHDSMPAHVLGENGSSHQQDVSSRTDEAAL